MARSSKKARKAAKPKAKAKTRRRTAGLRQFGAIPVRLSRLGNIEVLLLTSRGTGRWVIPKGWPMRSRSPAGTARREAYEEAGVKGQLLSERRLGTYRYRKTDDLPIGEITVSVFVLLVEKQLDDWPEKGQRRLRWFAPAKASKLLHERDLAKLVRAVPNLVALRRKIG